MIKTMPRMGKEWGLRFEIRPSSFSNGWKSILHLTTGGNCCKIGQRIPAFFWHTNKGNANQRSMHITFHRDGAGNAIVNSPLLAKNRWAKIKMSQRKVSNKYIISIQVNGKRIYTKENRSPRTFKNVKVYASDPYTPEAQGTLRRLKIPTIFIPAKMDQHPPFHHWTKRWTGRKNSCHLRSTWKQHKTKGIPHLHKHW